MQPTPPAKPLVPLAAPAADAMIDAVFANGGVGLCLLGPDGRVRRANDRWLTTVHLTREEAIGRDIWELFPGSPAELRALHDRVRAGEVVDVPEHRQEIDGRGVWFEGSLSPVPFAEGTGILVAAWEVTAQRRVERSAREQHANLRRHVTGTPLAVVEWDGEYRVIGYSERAQALFGFAPEEVVGKRIDEIPWIPEEDWPSVRAVMGDMRTASRPTNVNANRNRRKDGSTIHCEWYNSALHDAAGRLVSVLSLVLDVTERARLEGELRLSEERFRRLVEVSSQIVWVADVHGEIVADSPSWRAATGRSYEQWAGWSWLDAIHPEDRGPLAAAWRTAVDARTPYHVEFRLMSASGEYRHFECRAVPIFDADGGLREWVGMNVDIT